MSRTTNEPCKTRWLMSRPCRGDIPSIVSRMLRRKAGGPPRTSSAARVPRRRFLTARRDQARIAESDVQDAQGRVRLRWSIDGCMPLVSITRTQLRLGIESNAE